MIAYADEKLAIHCADVLDGLAAIEPGSVRTCVTSPPYWGLRDYGVPGQLGLEPTPEEYVERMVGVFRAVRDVLTDDGTLWLNLGDSYAAARGGTHQPAETLGGGVGGLTADGGRTNRDRHDGYNPSRNAHAIGLKHKDLVGIPWRVAFALQADGWYLRSDIIWSKPNPMPESVRDRPTKAHEYLFLLSKSDRYFYDADAIAESAVSDSISKFTDGSPDKQRGHGRRHAGFSGRYAEKLARDGIPETRNRRSVWTIATKPYPEAHFATFPPELPALCIKAGSEPGDTVLDPFAGAGTTLWQALELNRRAVGIELNPEYAALAVRRCAQRVML